MKVILWVRMSAGGEYKPIRSWWRAASAKFVESLFQVAA
jgi:hypothetical protein